MLSITRDGNTYPKGAIILYPYHAVIKFDNKEDKPTIEQMDKLSPAQLLYISTVVGNKIKKERCDCATFGHNFYGPRRFIRKESKCKKCDENGYVASFKKPSPIGRRKR